MTMDCWECKDNPGEKFEVKYSDDSIETVQLCEDCREKFLKGELISGIQLISSD